MESDNYYYHLISIKMRPICNSSAVIERIETVQNALLQYCAGSFNY